MERSSSVTIGASGGASVGASSGSTAASGTVVDARMSLALWLRTGRAQRGMSIEDVARVTKIQPRILERLEAGKLDGLPAEVFVRGFVRSVAKCVGLDEAEALKRYRDAASQPSPSARALLETMSELAPAAARATSPRQVVAEPISPPPAAPAAPAALAAGSLTDVPRATPVDAPVAIVADEHVAEAVAKRAPEAPAVEPVETATEVSEASTETESGKKKRGRRGGKGRGKRAARRSAIAMGTPSQPMPIVEEVVEAVVEPVVEPVVEAVADADPAAAPLTEVEVISEADAVGASAPWTPKMPTVVAPTVPWRRPAHAVAPISMSRLVPSLVIDDADPEIAEREREDRVAKEPTRRSFLPPILLDREDRSARQGGLTLAVIILLIAATLTLSYLMRRPSSSGDGVTQLPTPTSERATFA